MGPLGSSGSSPRPPAPPARASVASTSTAGSGMAKMSTGAVPARPGGIAGAGASTTGVVTASPMPGMAPRAAPGVPAPPSAAAPAPTPNNSGCAAAAACCCCLAEASSAVWGCGGKSHQGQSVVFIAAAASWLLLHRGLEQEQAASYSSTSTHCRSALPCPSLSRTFSVSRCASNCLSPIRCCISGQAFPQRRPRQQPARPLLLPRHNSRGCVTAATLNPLFCPLTS